MCLGQRCGYHRRGPRGAGVYAAQHAAGGECVSGGAAAGWHVPAQRDGKSQSQCLIPSKSTCNGQATSKNTDLWLPKNTTVWQSSFLLFFFLSFLFASCNFLVGSTVWPTGQSTAQSPVEEIFVDLLPTRLPWTVWNHSAALSVLLYLHSNTSSIEHTSCEPWYASWRDVFHTRLFLLIFNTFDK